MRKKIFFIIVLFGFACSSVFAESPMQKGGRIVVAQGETVEDIVAYGSTIIVKGSVFGTIYAVASDITVESTAEIKGDVTLIRGSLTISGAPALKGKVTVYDTMIKADLPYLVKGDTLVFRDTGFNIQSVQTPVSPDVLAYMEKYLIMPRPVPVGSDLFFPEFVTRDGFVQNITEFKISSLVEFSIQKEIMESSVAFSGMGDGCVVRITAVKFNALSDAKYFWNKVRTLPESRINHSLHISLGDGAHWYFRHKESSVALWYRNNWLFCVDVAGLGPVAGRDALRDKIVEFYIDKYKRSEQ